MDFKLLIERGEYMIIKKTLYGSSDQANSNDILTKVEETKKQVDVDVLSEGKYQRGLRRSAQKPLTSNKNKEPNVIYRGYDPEQGNHIAEDVTTGRRFQSEVLSNGPLAKDSRVMGFPPKPGQGQGYIRGPMKGPEIPPMEGKKKKRPKKEEEKKEINIYSLELIFVTGE